MTSFGFVIDQRKCIGCHACTVACKAENEVPVGEFRTWVKYVEKGTFPEVKRHFTVLRCNHCDEAPCVEICPVVALHKRPDAIVDLDRDQCIGCRACMQACPYDALYLNEDSGTAEKCHYCAHRTEIGLEPACVVVCPVEAIVAGDVDAPDGEIGRLIREQPTSRRKVEKGTKPRVWYVDALPEALDPAAATQPPIFLWSDRPRAAPTPVPGFETPPDIVASLNHIAKPQWGWHVWLYLYTKNLAAGAMMIAPFAAWLRMETGPWPEAVALLFLAITGVLLVHDLGRPERFHKIFTHPNWKSWLVKGSWVIAVFGALTSASLAAQLLGADGLVAPLRWLALPAAVLTSGYSAFLFAQCQGRDLWLERGFFAQLIARAALLGAGLALALPGVDAHGPGRATLLFGALAALNLTLLLCGLRGEHGNLEERIARARLRGDRAARLGLLLLLGAGIGVAAFFIRSPIPRELHTALGCALLALASLGLVLYERAWIRIPQDIPNS